MFSRVLQSKILAAPLIARAKRLWLKVAWSLVLIAGLVVFTVQSRDMMKDYYSYRTTTGLEVVPRHGA